MYVRNNDEIEKSSNSKTYYCLLVLTSFLDVILSQ